MDQLRDLAITVIWCQKQRGTSWQSGQI